MKGFYIYITTVLSMILIVLCIRALTPDYVWEHIEHFFIFLAITIASLYAEEKIDK